MKFRECEVAGAWVIEPTPLEDQRGRFMRAWCQREFAEHAIDFVPLQANMAFSIRKGTIRGLHYQALPALEALGRDRPVVVLAAIARSGDDGDDDLLG